MPETLVSERTLPHNLEAERSVLGAVLLHNDAFNLAAEVIDSADFYRDAHRRIFDTIEKLHARKELITGVPTGFTDLDEMTSGMQPSDLVIIAARPSMGKTSLVLNMAQHVGTKTDMTVGIFSLEMSKEQLFLRMLTGEARIDAHRLRGGFLGERDWGRLSEGIGTLSEAKIFIDDTPSIGVLEMRAK